MSLAEKGDVVIKNQQCYNNLCEVRLRTVFIMARFSFFETAKLYHIYNRGTDKRDVFLNDDDFGRGIRTLFEANDIKPVLNLYRRKLCDSASQLCEVRLRTVGKRGQSRELLVEILAFVLMKNHYHLFVRQLVDGGITKFMRKFGTGYTNYFNTKYGRSGVLFQGKFKAVPVVEQAHFLHLPYYIHANPLDYFDRGWRNGFLKDPEGALRFLRAYRWSSFCDYVGIHNFPSVTQRDFLQAIRGDSKEYCADFERWLLTVSEFHLEDMSSLLLE